MIDWSEQEDLVLRNLWNNHTAIVIGNRLGRSRGSVRGRGLRLGLPRRPRVQRDGSSATFWSTMDDDRLRSLWLDASLSASDIGKLIHRSRGSVMGRVFRLKLGPKMVPQPLSRSVKKERAIADKTPDKKLRSILVARAKANGILESLNQDVLPSEHKRKRLIPFAKLTDQSCRWPEGDPRKIGFGFCGLKRVGFSSPYCEEHSRRAFQCYGV